MRYKKKYTQEEWNRFKTTIKKKVGDQEYYLDVQELLCKKYDIILTDYRTRREKIRDAVKKINPENFNKGIDKFQKTMDDLSSFLDSTKGFMGSKDLTPLVKTSSKKQNYSGLLGQKNNQRDYSRLTGKKPVQKKKKRKTKPKQNKKKENYKNKFWSKKR